MILKVLGSNSSGNAYVLQGEKQTLLIECGVHAKHIMKAIDHNLDPVQGCIVSHNHGDHFKFSDQLVKYGIDIYGSAGTLKGKAKSKENGKENEPCSPYHYKYHAIKSKEQLNLGEFKIYAFDVIHDADEPFGYMVNHPESGNILFLTDSAYTQYTFKGMNQVIVEANHSEAYLRQKVLNGYMEYFVYKRLIESHMSIETCEKMLLANDLTDVRNIVLIHLSDSNSHEANFKKTIEAKTGKNVLIASKGTEIKLDMDPF